MEINMMMIERAQRDVMTAVPTTAPTRRNLPRSAQGSSVTVVRGSTFDRITEHPYAVNAFSGGTSMHRSAVCGPPG